MTRRRLVFALAVLVAVAAAVPASGASTTLSRLAKRVKTLTSQVRDVRDRDVQTTVRFVLAQQDESGAATATARANCPTNWAATGGGSDWVGSAFAGDTVIFSRPVGSPPTGWEVAARRDGVTGSTLKVYVVCARFS
jgi:hypothetical protein